MSKYLTRIKNGHGILAIRQDVGMEFGLEKCAMIVMKSGKRHLADGKGTTKLRKN